MLQHFFLKYKPNPQSFHNHFHIVWCMDKQSSFMYNYVNTYVYTIFQYENYTNNQTLRGKYSFHINKQNNLYYIYFKKKTVVVASGTSIYKGYIQCSIKKQRNS